MPSLAAVIEPMLAGRRIDMHPAHRIDWVGVMPMRAVIGLMVVVSVVPVRVPAAATARRRFGASTGVVVVSVTRGLLHLGSPSA
jgi:hypothetical protein